MKPLASDPEGYSLTAQVPRAPWLEADGIHPLRPGDDVVGIGCLPGLPRSCDRSIPGPTATFHLTGSGSPRCQVGPCATMSASPDASPVGDLIRIQGWAPLASLDVVDYDAAGRRVPCRSGYELIARAPGGEEVGLTAASEYGPRVLQSPEGDISVTLLLPGEAGSSGWSIPLIPGPYVFALRASLPCFAPTFGTRGDVEFLPGQSSSVDAILARTAFQVTNLLSWITLGPVRPRSEQATPGYGGQNGVFGEVVGLTPKSARLAYCADGAIEYSRNDGQSWSSVSIAGVAAEAIKIQQPTMGPYCGSVRLDATHPDTFYATFPSERVPANSGWPVPVGYVTTDAGRTWRAVPKPSPSAGFAGFVAVGTLTQALFVVPGNPNGVEETADSGRTWYPGHLRCPSEGPCVRWQPH
jgi:hypothetical protein